MPDPLPNRTAPEPTGAPGRARVRRWVLRIVLALVAGGALAAGGYWQWDRARARGAWTDAEQALARRDLAAAATHLDRYTRLRPDDPAGWFLASRTARRRGKFADAKRFLAEYETRGGPPEPARLERDLLLIQQGALGDSDVRLRASIDPDHPDAALILEALARGYMIAERWADARQACEMWRKLQPDDFRPWLWGGRISERMVQVEQATEFYTRALDLAPEDRDVRAAMGRLLLRRRDPGAASAHYEWIVARFPDDAEALFGLGQCRIEQGRAADAIPLIDRALSRDPNSSAGAALRGRAALETGDAPGAEKWLRGTVRAEPGDAEALHLLVLALRAQRKDAEADDLTGRLDALRTDLRKLTELLRAIDQLADAAPCHEAGVIALRVGRTQQGLNLLHDALRRPGDHRATHAALAAHYKQAGQPDRAQHHQSLADKP